MRTRLRVVVAGAGLIAQSVYIPLLRAMRPEFELVAVADASARVCREIAGRYCDLQTHQDWRKLFDVDQLDAIIVCSPSVTHSEITLEALRRGLHVFAEQPLALTVHDIDAIIAARDAGELVVQVGYLKRFDNGYLSLLSALPPDRAKLRLIDVVTCDPGMARAPFAPPDFILADDVTSTTRNELRESERLQVQSAIGPTDDRAVRAFVDIYFGGLMRDVNLIHGLLNHVGVRTPSRPMYAAHRADGKAATVMFEVAEDVRWHCSWLLLPAQEEFSERVRLYFDDQVQAIDFDAPYFRERPSVHEIRSGDGAGRQQVVTARETTDAYAAQLRHFHACVTDGGPCLTPPEQARIDTVALTEAFQTARGGLSGASQALLPLSRAAVGQGRSERDEVDEDLT